MSKEIIVYRKEFSNFRWKRLKNCRGHTSGVNSIIFFPPILVSCCYSNKIILWNIETGKKIQKIEEEVRLACHDLLKYSNDSFYACDYEGNIRGYKVDVSNQTASLFFELKIKEKIKRMMKLQSKPILLVQIPWRVFLIDAEKKEILKVLTVGKVEFGKCDFHLSTKYPSCFYISTEDEGNQIKMIDYNNETNETEEQKPSTNKKEELEEGGEVDDTVELDLFHRNLWKESVDAKVIREFKPHKKVINALSTFIQKKNNEEILVAGGNEATIFFYNSSNAELLFKIETSQNISRIRFLSSFNLLCVGEEKGCLELFLLEEEEQNLEFKKVLKIKKQKIHQERIEEIILIEKKKNCFTLTTCSGDSDDNISLFSIRYSSPKMVGNLEVTIISAKGLRPADSDGKSDPFCELRIGDNDIKQSDAKEEIKSVKTKIIKNTLDPTWDESFEFDILDGQKNTLFIDIWDWDRFTSNDYLGYVCCSLAFIPRDHQIIVDLEVQGEGMTGSIRIALEGKGFGYSSEDDEFCVNQIQSIQENYNYVVE